MLPLAMMTEKMIRMYPSPLEFGSEIFFPLKETLGRIACTMIDPSFPEAADMPKTIQYSITTIGGQCVSYHGKYSDSGLGRSRRGG